MFVYLHIIKLHFDDHDKEMSACTRPDPQPGDFWATNFFFEYNKVIVVKIFVYGRVRLSWTINQLHVKLIASLEDWLTEGRLGLKLWLFAYRYG